MLEEALTDESPMYITRVMYNECVCFKASIRCYPKYSRVNWIKNDSGPLDIKNVKYRGSSSDGDNLVLCINNATKEDEGTYKMEAHNEYGSGESQLVRLDVIGGN